MVQVIGTSLGDPTATVSATLASGSTVGSPHPALHVAEREMLEAIRLDALGTAAPASAVVHSATYRSRRPVTNASEFRWTCDGTGDEVEINAAILAVANEGGGCVQLLGPLFNIAGSITLRTGVWLRGEGLGTILRASSGFGAGVVTLFDNTTHATILSHLTIDGASSAVYGVHYSANGGEVFSSPDPDTNPDPAHVIEKLFIRGCGSSTSPMAGMRMQGGNLRAGKYMNIRILSCSNGVWVDGAVDSVYHDIEVGSSGNNVSGVPYSVSTTAPIGHGFFINGDQNIFSQCHAWYSRGAGYYARATRLQFNGCSAQDNHSAGFHGAFGKNVYSGCIADSNGQAVGADARLRCGFYFSSDFNNVQACTSFDRGSHTTWYQQYGFQITGGFTYSRLDGITYGNELAGLTGTPPSTSKVDVIVDSTGK